MKLSQDKKQHIHLIGVGGVGMCGIAELLKAHGYSVSGSDAKDSVNLQRLRALGIQTKVGHRAEHVAHADIVVYSSAINDSNPEWQAAKQAGVPLLQRAEMLAELMVLACGVAVSGTHGKTTTTGLVTHLLLSAGQDPSYAIGGELLGIKRYAALGKGAAFVAEADESDASFLHLRPKVAIVTNIEPDHMSTYEGSLLKLEQTFASFVANLPAEGLAVLCWDDARVRPLRTKLPCRAASYGFSPEADYVISNCQQEGLQTGFCLCGPDGEQQHLQVNLPGRHNVLNAVAAIVVARYFAVAWSDIDAGLRSFPGVGRRFHIHGALPVKGGEALVIDDYGHHPSAVQVTLEAARQAWPTRRLVLVFQPHRYSRTKDLLLDFAKSLAAADVLVLLDVYAAGEAAISGADGAALCQAIAQLGQVEPLFVPDDAVLASTLQQLLEPDDVVIMQGAGNISAMAKALLGVEV
jgi:UDP-N-acetylmuramate--alanine ligase